MTTAELDMARVEEQAGRIFGYLGGTMVSLGIRLGDQLGLYKAMAGAGTLSSEALAGKTNLNERWVREWLAHQASAGLVDYRGNTDFSLSDETALVLAYESTPASGIGMFGFIDEAIKVANEHGRGHEPCNSSNDGCLCRHCASCARWCGGKAPGRWKGGRHRLRERRASHRLGRTLSSVGVSRL